MTLRMGFEEGFDRRDGVLSYFFRRKMADIWKCQRCVVWEGPFPARQDLAAERDVLKAP